MRTLAGALAAGGMAVTLMACYGMPPQVACETDDDCESGEECGESGYCQYAPVCGDAYLDPGEQCDEEFETASCSESCEVLLDGYCLELPTLALDTSAGDLSSSGTTHAFDSSCGPSDSYERAYSFVAGADGELVVGVDASDSASVYVLAGCGEGAMELACGDAGGSVSVQLLTGDEVTVVVEAASTGTYTLTASFTPP